MHCHDISDQVWKALAERLPGQRGQWGGVARDNRLFINAVIWVFRTGAPWRDLPGDFGDWKNTRRRFCRWRERGVWEALLDSSFSSSFASPISSGFSSTPRTSRRTFTPPGRAAATEAIGLTS